MTGINRIVVLVDFLKNTEKLVEYAVYMAGKLSVPTHFIHVVDFFSDDPLLDNPYVQHCEEQLLADAESRMSVLIANNSKRYPSCTGEVVRGNPVEKVFELGNTVHSDLIMITPLETW